MEPPPHRQTLLEIRQGLCTWTVFGQIDKRLWVKASINGKPIALAVDTGATDLFPLPKAAERLGLVVTNAARDVPSATGVVRVGATEECEVAIADGNPVKVALTVIEDPATDIFRDIDGVLGWYQLRAKIFMINARLGIVNWLSQVPEEAVSWTQLKLRTNSDVLRLGLPGNGGKPSVLFVDTGSVHGVALPPERWRTWKATHKSQPATLAAYYSPSLGLVVAEESWAKELTFALCC
jgi:hypothetical protein